MPADFWSWASMGTSWLTLSMDTRRVSRRACSTMLPSEPRTQIGSPDTACSRSQVSRANSTLHWRRGCAMRCMRLALASRMECLVRAESGRGRAIHGDAGESLKTDSSGPCACHESRPRSAHPHVRCNGSGAMSWCDVLMCDPWCDLCARYAA
jgi:hypothetical protein